MNPPELGKVLDQNCQGGVETETGEDGDLKVVPKPISHNLGAHVQYRERVNLSSYQVQKPDDLYRGVKDAINHFGGKDKSLNIIQVSHGP